MRYSAIFLSMLLSGLNLYARCPSAENMGYSLSILNPESEGIAEYFKIVVPRIVHGMSEEHSTAVRNIKTADDFVSILTVMKHDSKDNPIVVEEEDRADVTRCRYYLTTPTANRLVVSFEMLH